MQHRRIALALLVLIAAVTTTAWWVGTGSGLELDEPVLTSIAGATWLFFVAALRGGGTTMADAHLR